MIYIKLCFTKNCALQKTVRYKSYALHKTVLYIKLCVTKNRALQKTLRYKKLGVTNNSALQKLWFT